MGKENTLARGASICEQIKNVKSTLAVYCKQPPNFFEFLNLFAVAKIVTRLQAVQKI
jgi:hypothetical protein